MPRVHILFLLWQQNNRYSEIEPGHFVKSECYYYALVFVFY